MASSIPPLTQHPQQLTKLTPQVHTEKEALPLRQHSFNYSTYLGVSFAVFLSLFPSLHSRNCHLLIRLRKADDELAELRARRQEDSKANARVVEIFASHRTSWQQDERRLLRRLDHSADEINRLRSRLEELEERESHLLGKVEDLRREVGERDELLNFMSRHTAVAPAEEREWGGVGGGGEDNMAFGKLGISDYNYNDNDIDNDGFDGNFMASSADSKFWVNRHNHNHNDIPVPSLWQDVPYQIVEPTHHVKHFVVRRESPWKADCETTGVPSKLKLLEEELLKLDKVGKNSSPKVASLMRKQAKRYQDLAAKVDDLCKRMQASDQSEAALSSEHRSQRQSEFLLEAFQLQQRASETGKKLLALQTEIYSNCTSDELEVEAKLAMRRSVDSIRSNFKEIQRNLEIWLARIMGDLEGIRARGGASRARDYYLPRYPDPYINSFS